MIGIVNTRHSVISKKSIPYLKPFKMFKFIWLYINNWEQDKFNWSKRYAWMPYCLFQLNLSDDFYSRKIYIIHWLHLKSFRPFELLKSPCQNRPLKFIYDVHKVIYIHIRCICTYVTAFDFLVCTERSTGPPKLVTSFTFFVSRLISSSCTGTCVRREGRTQNLIHLIHLISLNITKYKALVPGRPQSLLLPSRSLASRSHPEKDDIYIYIYNIDRIHRYMYIYRKRKQIVDTD